MFFHSRQLPLTVLSFSRGSAAIKGNKSRPANIVGGRGKAKRPAARVNYVKRDFEEIFHVVAVASADAYDLRKARTAVRESKYFAIAKELPPHVRDVLHVQESLGVGRQRNSFIFGCGAVVVWDIKGGETACSPALKSLLSDIGQSQFSEDPQWLDSLDYKVDANRAISGRTDETVILAEKASEEVAHMDQLAVSHALANSLRLRVIEAEVDEITQKCLPVISEKFSWTKVRMRRSAFKFWQTASELQNRATHLMDGADDYYWDYHTVEDLFEDVQDELLDYHKRLRRVNTRLEYSRSVFQHVHGCAQSSLSQLSSLLIFGILLVAVTIMMLNIQKERKDKKKQSPSVKQIKFDQG